MARGSDSRLYGIPATDCNILPCRAMPPRCVITGPHCCALQPRPRRTRQLAVVSFDNAVLMSSPFSASLPKIILDICLIFILMHLMHYYIRSVTTCLLLCRMTARPINGRRLAERCRYAEVAKQGAPTSSATPCRCGVRCCLLGSGPPPG